MKRVVFFKSSLLLSVAACLCVLAARPATAAEGNFSIQVSPSPLVTTVKPGVTTEQELKIRNASTAPENLRIQLRAFKFDEKTGNVILDETIEPEISRWVSFSDPTFTVQPGQWFTQKIRFALPEETGFSYSFALQIIRSDAPDNLTTGGRSLIGSVAVFGLVNIDRPGAKKNLELVSFESAKQLYEYLPTTLNVRLKNTGNTIIQPYGNIYVLQDKAGTPLATLPLNAAQSYLLPGTERSLSASWDDGFPRLERSTDSQGKPAERVSWNIQNANKFRFGRYTAKVVAVYNDGTRDVPVTGEVSFWVIPWKAILVALSTIIGLVAVLHWYIRRRTAKAIKKALAAKKSAS